MPIHGSPLFNTLAMAGFGLIGLSTYFVVLYINKVPDDDTSPQLGLLGDVFGMKLPTLVVVRHTLNAGLFGIGALGICDILYARHTKARYFALHVICNVWISVLSLPDCWYVLSDPLAALAASKVNHWPTSLVFSIHVYHMLFFRNLQWLDWVHHILMVVIGAPLLITGEVGPLANINNFFMCGVPGGADYAMLLAVKHGWIEPLTEKNINASINVWIRAPALVVMASFAYLQCFIQRETPYTIMAVRLFLIGLGLWNGLYFMERVVGNAHVNNYKAKLERKKASGDETPPRPESPGESVYESAEHLQNSLPGFGMRISVSMKDLTELSRETKKVQ